MAAAADLSLMGGRDSMAIRGSLKLAVGVLLLCVGLTHLQAANAQSRIQNINLSTVPLNVTARVNAAIVGSVVVPALNLNVNLPLANNVLVNATITNLLSGGSTTSLLSVNANSALLFIPSLLPGRVNVVFGYLFGLAFIPTSLLALGL